MALRQWQPGTAAVAASDANKASKVGKMSIGPWLRDRPRILESAFQFTHWLFEQLNPIISRLGYDRADRWMRPAERLSKGVLFDCRMCGQCILHSTGMTCPMTCPKSLRNGPCGGVRNNGHCEVIPEMRCVWVEAYERSQRMSTFGGEIVHIQPPVDRQLQDSSAWINALNGTDSKVPEGWEGTSHTPVIQIEDIEEWRPNLNQTAA